MTDSEPTSATMPDIGHYLLRNLDLDMVVAAGARLITDQTKSEALEETQFICFVGTEAPEATRSLVTDVLQQALSHFCVPVDYTRWIIRGLEGLSENEQSRMIDAITQLRFNGDLRAEPIPLNAPRDTWFVVRSTDVLLDLLLQPLRAISDFVRDIVDAWMPFIERGLRLFPDLNHYDPDLYSLEAVLAESFNSMPFDAIETGFNVRFGAVTTSQVSFGNGLAALRSRADLDTYGLRQIGHAQPLPITENVDLIVNQSIGGLQVDANADEGTWHIDPYFGHAYREAIMLANSGLYRPNDASTPDPPLNETSFLPNPSFGWLSVPFRRVPRFFISSLDQLTELASLAKSYVEANSDRYGGRPLLFRGQNREHLLGRDPGALTLLYDDPLALEPSLLPSQARRATEPEAVAAFNSVFQALIGASESLGEGEKFLWDSRLGDYLKIGNAQHYGLATPALDLTTDLPTAVWFAVTQLRQNLREAIRSSPILDSQIAVVYFFVPNTRAFHSINFNEIQQRRPAAQNGWVHTTGWGLRKNRIAESLLLAAYIPGKLADSMHHILPSAADLFPGEEVDRTISVIKRWARQSPKSRITKELLRDLYEVI